MRDQGQRIHVTAGGNRVADQLFGRGPVHRIHQQRAGRQRRRRSDSLGDAEVGQLGERPAGGPPQQDVLGLDVQVNHPAPVQLGQRPADGQHHAQHLAGLQRPAPLDQRRQGAVVDQLADLERDRAAAFLLPPAGSRSRRSAAAPGSHRPDSRNASPTKLRSTTAAESGRHARDVKHLGAGRAVQALVVDPVHQALAALGDQLLHPVAAQQQVAGNDRQIPPEGSDQARCAPPASGPVCVRPPFVATPDSL